MLKPMRFVEMGELARMLTNRFAKQDLTTKDVLDEVTKQPEFKELNDEEQRALMFCLGVEFARRINDLEIKVININTQPPTPSMN